ncbi:MAG TPA: 5-oxoprolinase subunit PxpA [Anaerolineales bacterium]|nr:5-oxoprolinase subunit PxpA [Anaerolineales bacterium]
MMIDLNCDMGESFGRYTLGHDEAIMPLITSANIACGFHAGDPLVMARTVALAARFGVGVGAHPGCPDLQGFGRRSMDLSSDEVESIVLYQVGALAGFARAAGAELAHVKPHGALYNQAATDRVSAQAIARGVARFSKNLTLVGLAGSVLIEAGVEAGLHVANEGFPDRAYNPDGTLMSRRMPGAVLESPEEAAAHAVRLVRDGIAFRDSRVRVDTLCIHGDNANAPLIAEAVRAALEANGVEVETMGKFL